MNRYQTIDISGYSRLICKDCSTRVTLVSIPVEEKSDHDKWHHDHERKKPTQVETFMDLRGFEV